jgi:hypothetical protein
MPGDEKLNQLYYNLLPTVYGKKPDYDIKGLQSMLSDSRQSQQIYSDISKFYQDKGKSFMSYTDWRNIHIPAPATTGNVTKEIPPTTPPPDNTGLATVSQSELQQEPGANQPVNFMPPGWTQEGIDPQQQALAAERKNSLTEEQIKALGIKRGSEDIPQMQSFGSVEEEMEYINANTTPTQRTAAYILGNVVNNSAIGLALKIDAKNHGIEDRDVFLENYQPSTGEEIGAGLATLMADVMLFPLGAGANAVVGKLAVKALEQGVKRDVLAGVAKTLLKPAVQTGIQMATGNAASLGVYEGTKDLLTQLADPNKDIHDINYGQTLKSGIKGSLVGLAVGGMNYATKIVNTAIKASLTEKPFLSAAVRGGISTTGFIGENAAFLYGYSLMDGGRPITGKDWVMSAATLGAMKLPRMFSRSKNFDQTKVNKDEFEVQFDKKETKQLGGENIEDIINKYKDKDELRKVFEDEKIPQLTKAKLAWALEGIAPKGTMDITSIDTKDNTLTARDRDGNKVFEREYDSPEQAQEEALNFGSIVVDRQKRLSAAVIPIEARLDIINEFKVSGGNSDLLQSALDKSFEPWMRTPEEMKELDRFDKGVQKFWDEREKQIETLELEKEKITEELTPQEGKPMLPEKKQRLTEKKKKIDSELKKLKSNEKPEETQSQEAKTQTKPAEPEAVETVKAEKPEEVIPETKPTETTETVSKEEIQ